MIRDFTVFQSPYILPTKIKQKDVLDSLGWLWDKSGSFLLSQTVLRLLGSFYVSEKLPTYLSPKPTLCLK